VSCGVCGLFVWPVLSLDLESLKFGVGIFIPAMLAFAGLYSGAAVLFWAQVKIGSPLQIPVRSIVFPTLAICSVLVVAATLLATRWHVTVAYRVYRESFEGLIVEIEPTLHDHRYGQNKEYTYMAGLNRRIGPFTVYDVEANKIAGCLHLELGGGGVLLFKCRSPCRVQELASQSDRLDDRWTLMIRD
jgi:hypothetical protein